MSKGLTNNSLESISICKFTHLAIQICIMKSGLESRCSATWIHIRFIGGTSFDASVPDVIHSVWKAMQSLPSIKWTLSRHSRSFQSLSNKIPHVIIWRLFSSNQTSQKVWANNPFPSTMRRHFQPQTSEQSQPHIPQEQHNVFLDLHSAPRRQARLLAASWHSEPGASNWQTRGSVEGTSLLLLYFLYF